MGVLWGLVGVLRGRLMACMACVCYAVRRLQKHVGDVPVRAVFVQELQSASNTFEVIKFSPLRRRATTGIGLALQRRHQRRYTTFNVGCRGGCWEYIDEEIHVRLISGIRVVWLGWIISSSSDNLSRIPSRLADQAQSRLVGCRSPLLHTLCVGITHVQSIAFFPLAFPVRGQPKSRSRIPCLSYFIVRWRGLRVATQILGFDRCSGHGAFTAHVARVVIEECYLVDPASSHMVVSKIKPCIWARTRSYTVLVSTKNDADQGLADVAFRTPPAPYEKSKFSGFLRGRGGGKETYKDSLSNGELIGNNTTLESGGSIVRIVLWRSVLSGGSGPCPLEGDAREGDSLVVPGPCHTTRRCLRVGLFGNATQNRR
uniref:Uncharacterized protein n=1 Tax=Solanum tuberosum TaxID=4113 RepID=M0ZZR9_SOLTU